MCLYTNDLLRIFQELDKNGDGLLSLEELNWLIETIFGVHLSSEDLESSIGKPCLSFDEFLVFYESLTKQNTRNVEDREDHHQVVEEEVAVTEVDSSNGGNDDDDDEEIVLFEAFKVFDLDGDGYITSEELQSVLLRLGLWDEKNGKDCRSMICVFDTNSDGVLDFGEFKNMMIQRSSA